MKLWGYLNEFNEPVSLAVYNRQSFGKRAKPEDSTSLLAFAKSAGLQLLFTEDVKTPVQEAVSRTASRMASELFRQCK